jgi:hypothetical protein
MLLTALLTALSEDYNSRANSTGHSGLKKCKAHEGLELPRGTFCWSKMLVAILTEALIERHASCPTSLDGRACKLVDMVP